MKKIFKKFLRNEEGAITVDWIVLTAAVTGLGLAGIGSLQQGVNNLARNIETGISIKTVSNGD